MLAAIAEVWRHLTQKNWAGGLTSCNEESGNGPSLGCAALEENGHTKRERRVLSEKGSHFPWSFLSGNRGQREEVVSDIR